MVYSWGDDYRPTAPAAATSFRSAREAYKSEKGAGTAAFVKSVTSTVHAKNVNERAKLNAHSDKRCPIVVCCDHTGSFQHEVVQVLMKLPLLDGEVTKYLRDYDICLSLVGDVTSDRYPLQVEDPAMGSELDEKFSHLYVEGQGGDTPESYDIAAYYFTHHFEMPNAVKPIFIFILDAPTRSRVTDRELSAVLGIDGVQGGDSEHMLKALSSKFKVYVIAKGYKEFWSGIYGEQSVIPYTRADDLVEIMVGLIAVEAGDEAYKDWERKSSLRHADRPDRIERVSTSVLIAKEAKVAEDKPKFSKSDKISKRLV